MYGRAGFDLLRSRMMVAAQKKIREFSKTGGNGAGLTGAAN
jgi:hypothetical protein